MEELQRRYPEVIRPPAPRPIGTGTGGDNDLEPSGTVHVTWGALIDELELVGMTVGEALTLLQDAYNIAMTPPCAPTLVVIDMEFQKAEVPGMTAPGPRPLRVTGIDEGQAREIARGLVAASNPRIAVGRLRTPEGVARAVELAELVGASTSTAATGGPMSFPQRHPLCGPGADTNYDFTLGLEAQGAQASITGPHIRTLEQDRDVTDIGYGGNRPGGGNRGGAK